MVVMKEGATPEEIAQVLAELKKYGLTAIVVKVPCWGFNNRNFKEER